MAQNKIKPQFTSFQIATKGDWEIILRPEAAHCGWINCWVDVKTADGVSNRHLVSFNVNTRYVDGAVGWQNLRRDFPDVADWFYETLDKQFPYCKTCHDQWRRRGCR